MVVYSANGKIVKTDSGLQETFLPVNLMEELQKHDDASYSTVTYLVSMNYEGEGKTKVYISSECTSGNYIVIKDSLNDDNYFSFVVMVEGKVIYCDYEYPSREKFKEIIEIIFKWL